MGLHRAVWGGYIHENKEVPSRSTKISEELEIFEEKRISEFLRPGVLLWEKGINTIVDSVLIAEGRPKNW